MFQYKNSLFDLLVSSEFGKYCVYLVKKAFGALYSDHRGVQGWLPNDVGFIPLEFMSKNFPYKYSETLNSCAYSGHALTCPVYA